MICVCQPSNSRFHSFPHVISHVKVTLLTHVNLASCPKKIHDSTLKMGNQFLRGKSGFQFGRWNVPSGWKCYLFKKTLMYFPTYQPFRWNLFGISRIKWKETFSLRRCLAIQIIQIGACVFSILASRDSFPSTEGIVRMQCEGMFLL